MVQDEPRWLTPDERDAWVPLAIMTTWLPAALDAQLRRDADLSHVEYQVLSWISMDPGRTVRMSELARFAGLNLSHLSRVAARLEQRGWLDRSPDPGDGRVTLAHLTDAGWTAVRTAAPGHVAEVRRLVFDNLDDAQVAALRDIATAIADVARPGGEPIPRSSGRAHPSAG